MSTCQRGFVKERSVATSMVGFLQKNYQALDVNSNEQIVALFIDFSKALGMFSHFELMKKVANIGVGGCLLEVLANYLDVRKKFMRVDNVSSRTLDMTSGVLQGSLLWSLLFSIFVNDLPIVVKFGDPFVFADDFKLLAHGNLESEIESDLEQIARWVKESKMEMAPKKRSQLVIKGRIPSFWLARGPLESTNMVTDLGIVVNTSLT